MINKLLPIFDNTKRMPSFYAAKTLSKGDVKDVIRLYEYMMNLESKRISFKRDVSEKTDN